MEGVGFVGGGRAWTHSFEIQPFKESRKKKRFKVFEIGPKFNQSRTMWVI